MNYELNGEKTIVTSMMLIAVVATLALLGVIAVTIVIIPLQQHQAEATRVLTQCSSTAKSIRRTKFGHREWMFIQL